MSTAPDAPPPPAMLLQLLTGGWVAQTLCVLAELGVADELAGGPLGAAELAQRVGAHAGALHRLLRAAASVGVFRSEPDGRFALTPMAEHLRRSHPGSLHATAVMFGREHSRAWCDLIGSARTGEIAFDRVYGKSWWAHLQEHPDSAAVFNRAMTDLSRQHHRALLAAYDFRPFRRIIDVGGGHGTLLSLVLGAAPAATGAVYDLPQVVAGAQATFEAAGLGARAEAIGGDFFSAVPPGADAYILSHIIHDWEEPKALAILRTIRAAIAPGGRLLLVETVIPEGDEPHLGKWLDLNMLAMVGGRERTAREYGELYRAAGFELVRVVPTAAPISLIEGRPA